MIMRPVYVGVTVTAYCLSIDHQPCRWPWPSQLPRNRQEQFMRPGHEIRSFSRWTCSENDFSLNYNTHIANTRTANNWLRDQPFAHVTVYDIVI